MGAVTALFPADIAFAVLVAEPALLYVSVHSCCCACLHENGCHCRDRHVHECELPRNIECDISLFILFDVSIYNNASYFFSISGQIYLKF